MDGEALMANIYFKQRAKNQSEKRACSDWGRLSILGLLWKSVPRSQSESFTEMFVSDNQIQHGRKTQIFKVKL